MLAVRARLASMMIGPKTGRRRLLWSKGRPSAKTYLSTGRRVKADQAPSAGPSDREDKGSNDGPVVRNELRGVSSSRDQSTEDDAAGQTTEEKKRNIILSGRVQDNVDLYKVGQRSARDQGVEYDGRKSDHVGLGPER
jgi:hypothetical protein